MADAKFPEFVRSTEYRRELGLKRKRAIRKMYSDIAAETEKKIRDIEQAGKWSGTTVLQMKHLRDLQKSIEASLKDLGNSLEKDILSDMKKIAEVTCTDVAGFLRRSGAGVGMSLANVPDKVVRNIVSGNIYGQRWTFSKAIWNDYSKASGDLALIVSKGLAAQKPIYDIAKDLEKYVNPAVRKDYDWSRLYPGSKKQVDYNAYRLAQTMSTHAHQQAVIISCKEDPLVDGVEWRSSGSSRVCPLCEQRNGEVFPLDKCPMDHPMGQCILIPHIKKTGNDPHKDAADSASDSFEQEFRERQRQSEEARRKAVEDAEKKASQEAAKKQLTSSGDGGILNLGRGSGSVKGSYPDYPPVELINADTSDPVSFVIRYALDNGFRESKIERMVYVRADGKAFVKDGFEYGIGTASVADQLKDAVTLHCHPDYLGMPGGSFSIDEKNDLFDMFAQKTKMDFVMDSKHVYGMKVDWSKIKDEEELAEMIRLAKDAFSNTHTTEYLIEDYKHEICQKLTQLYPDVFKYDWR